MRKNELPTSPISVDSLSILIKETIESTSELARVAVRGEISDLKRHSSGHCYFTLSGRDSRISGVLFRSDAASVLKWPQPGDEVLVGGRISTYPQRGTYQLYAKRMMPLGRGAADRAKEEAIEILSREGLFDVAKKRPIEAYPSRICCITSPTGAAVKDVLKVSGERNRSVDVTIIPCLVQGLEAPESIVKAFSLVRGLSVDTVLLVRGGGSRDDLVPFDDLDVVRVIASCPVPVVTGIGHQVDMTLADMAADLRCATPSEAAEASVPSSKAMLSLLDHKLYQLMKAALSGVERSRGDLDYRESRLDRLITRSIYEGSSKVDLLDKELILSIKSALSTQKTRLAELSAGLFGVSPVSTLARGFIACRDGVNTPIKSIDQVKGGDLLYLDLVDGVIQCEVKSVEPIKRGELSYGAGDL
nr:exodeoxyribonuclease VII large subunit [uncultured Dethiosulfovibrio sp.]